MDKNQQKARLEKWKEAESPFFRRWRVYSTFFTGFAIGLFYVVLISEKTAGWEWIGDDGHRALVLIFSGILGGVIYTIMIDGHVEMPEFIENRGDQFRAGLFGDILLGIAGAIVLDYIAQPLTDLDSSIEVAAAGIVGGYGGRAILQFALQRVFKDINLLEPQRQAYLQANLQRRLDRMDSLTLIDLVDQQIKEGLASGELRELTTEIEKADSGVRKRIFNLVQDMRLAAKGSGERARIERMIPIFETLTKADPDQHVYFAELAFAYKDSGTTDFFQPLQYLDQAISIRSEQQRAATWNYDLSRAITRIEVAHKRKNSYDFDTQTEDLIIKDLLAVSNIYNFETLLKDIQSDNIPLPLLNWVRHNRSDLLARDDTANLALKITNFLEAESGVQDAPSNTVDASPDNSRTIPSAPSESDERSSTVERSGRVSNKINRSLFFKEYRDIFRIQKMSQEEVNVFDAIFDYWDNSPHIDSRWLAYAMATAYHETGRRMVPVREGFAKNDASAIRAVEQLLASGGITWNYAKPEANGKSYFGRGLVQITHGENYLKLGKAIGLGTKLYDDPSLALDKDISVQLLFKGMIDGLYRGGHKLSVYFNQEREDWYGAREMINGDKTYRPKWADGESIGDLIAEYGRDFHRCCKASAIELSLQGVSDSNRARPKQGKHWMEAVKETWLKQSPDPVDLVLPEHKKVCSPGTRYDVENYQKARNNHYLVTLADGQGEWYIFDSEQENHWDTTWENDHGEADESGNHTRKKRGKPSQKAPVGEKLTKGMSFDTLITPNIAYGEFSKYQEARRFDHDYQCKVAYEICLFLEKCREHFGNKPLTITSGYRPWPINQSVGGADNSEHLYNHPEKGAVDFYIDGVDIYELQNWCDHNYPHSIGYGAHRGFIHLGFRPGKERWRWDY